jgi:dipeptidyl aminopeptidase/acylaminoacyl peptidase
MRSSFRRRASGRRPFPCCKRETSRACGFEEEVAMARTVSSAAVARAVAVAAPPLLALSLLAPGAALAAGKRPLALEDMFRIQRISDVALSPDGRRVVYTVATPDLEANKIPTDLWIAPLDGGPARRLTTHEAHDRRPAWSPDGRWIAFESTRDGRSQIWLIDPDGGEARPLTRISTEASRPVWLPDGKAVAFVSAVFPEHSSRPFKESDELNRKRLEEIEKSNVKARVYTRLLYRHWDSWWDGRRQHIFLQPIDGGDPLDLTPGDLDAIPTSSTFAGETDFAFSPDGKEIAFTVPPMKDEAISTAHDIYAAALEAGAAGERRRLTENPAADGNPLYSPDGRFLAYRAQSRPGFEADRWELMLLDRSTGKARSLTARFDGSVEAPVWAPDGRSLYFESETEGRVALYSVSVAGGEVRKVFDRHTSRSVSVTPDGATLVFLHQSATRPAEIFRLRSDGSGLEPVTRANEGLLAGLEVLEPESVWYEGEGRTRLQAWVFKPPGFDPKRRVPLVYLVHGGPQSAWLDSWSYRWNPALWAAQGYVVMAPNPRGSTGFGQKFTDAISRDWGGKVFVDLAKGVEWAERQSYVDAGRMAAAGASYGGYMMNWFQGMLPGRFRTLVVHCGVYNSVSMYGTTEELWFEEWEHGGTPWDNPEEFERFSPHRHAARFNTPALIIHNELDFRVPISEGLQLFTTLQRRGIPSKLMVFPDEGHWVLKPANSRFWHETVFSWLADHLKPAG